MKQLTIHIPEGKFQFVLELLRSLRFVKIDSSSDKFIISDEQKKLVEEEYRKMEENPGYAPNWDEAKHLIKVD